MQELRELRSLRHENNKLKQLVADLTLDRHARSRYVDLSPGANGRPLPGFVTAGVYGSNDQMILGIFHQPDNGSSRWTGHTASSFSIPMLKSSRPS